MLFNSGIFLFFFIAVYALYRLSPHLLQNRLLLVASYCFYGYWDWRFLSLIFISTLVDYAAGLAIADARRTDNPARARRWLVTSVAVNLGILGAFKYFDFFAAGFAEMLAPMGVEVPPLTLDVVLPVGISFYTFQTLGYTLDVHRGRAKPTSDFLDFALFVSFFPQLMAGPIERARHLIPQLQRPRRIGPDELTLGCWLIFWGLFKKVFIADNLASYTDWGAVQDGAATGLDTYVCAFAFSVRFYCDFSGYSDMARGLAQVMGIRLSNNFQLPYFASNPADLWTRWHITLGRWFRDHLYGNLRGLLPSETGRLIALFLTMSLVGLWHGANSTFVLWGVGWGLLFVSYRLLHPMILASVRQVPALALPLRFGGMFFIFHCWMLGGLLFVSYDLAQAFAMQHEMLTDFMNGSALTRRDALTVLYFSWPLIVMQAVQAWSGDNFVLLRSNWVVRYAAYLVLALLLFSNGAETERDFLYFQF